MKLLLGGSKKPIIRVPTLSQGGQTALDGLEPGTLSVCPLTSSSVGGHYRNVLPTDDYPSYALTFGVTGGSTVLKTTRVATGFFPNVTDCYSIDETGFCVVSSDNMPGYNGARANVSGGAVSSITSSPNTYSWAASMNTRFQSVGVDGFGVVVNQNIARLVQCNPIFTDLSSVVLAPSISMRSWARPAILDSSTFAFFFDSNMRIVTRTGTTLTLGTSYEIPGGYIVRDAWAISNNRIVAIALDSGKTSASLLLLSSTGQLLSSKYLGTVFSTMSVANVSCGIEIVSDTNGNKFVIGIWRPNKTTCNAMGIYIDLETDTFAPLGSSINSVPVASEYLGLVMTAKMNNNTIIISDSIAVHALSITFN